MVRLSGAASPTYISVFRGLKAHFLRHGIELDWVLYSDYDALVEAFVRREIDLAWNAPLAYVKIKRRLQDPGARGSLPRTDGENDWSLRRGDFPMPACGRRVKDAGRSTAACTDPS